MVPKNTVPVTDEKTARSLLKLLENLEDHDDVQKVHANFDIDGRTDGGDLLRHESGSLLGRGDQRGSQDQDHSASTRGRVPPATGSSTNRDPVSALSPAARSAPAAMEISPSGCWKFTRDCRKSLTCMPRCRRGGGCVHVAQSRVRSQARPRPRGGGPGRHAQGSARFMIIRPGWSSRRWSDTARPARRRCSTWSGLCLIFRPNPAAMRPTRWPWPSVTPTG
jgi:hypothetical protein